MSNVTIKLVNLTKSYDHNDVVKKINLDIMQGEFITLLGPSGCGKTTTLRMIAGFEMPDDGGVYLDGVDITNLKPYKRSVNTVFQNYALFPHLNVFDNIAFGLVEKKTEKKIIRQKVTDMLELTQLSGLEKRMPHQLSGGQKQRVAIARALVLEPPVLLLDEPLGALDLKLRKQMQIELKHLQKTLGITFVFVTHDQEEALTMSDRIAVMKDGNIEQIGTPEEIYNKPATKFVADFIGESNIIDAYVDRVYDGKIHLSLESGDCTLNCSGFALEEMVYICVRPENLKMTLDDIPDFNIYGKVVEHVFVGAEYRTVVEFYNGATVKIRTPQTDILYEIGTEVNLYWNQEHDVVLHTKEDLVYNIIEQTVVIKN